jgi:hypothetical protein
MQEHGQKRRESARFQGSCFLWVVVCVEPELSASLSLRRLSHEKAVKLDSRQAGETGFATMELKPDAPDPRRV